MKRNNLIGQKFGRLKVLEFAFIKKEKSYWKCLCECGIEKNVGGRSLIDGHTKSCGCLKKETIIEISTKHDMSRTKFYRVWARMKERCSNKNHKDYKHYGERGITVCKKWMKFENFRDDMYQDYLKHIKQFGRKETTLERNNNNLGYCKSNCSWEIWEKQRNNKRNNVSITYKGKTMNISQWAKKFNLDPIILRGRIFRNNWNMEKALITPIKRYKKKI